MVCGDFNGDQRPDIITAAPEEGKIYFLWNNGQRSFRLGQPLDAWPFTRNLATGDFDGDGNLDLAAAGKQHGLAVFNGDGTGGFEPAQLLQELAFHGGARRYRPVYTLKTIRPPAWTKDLLVVGHAEVTHLWNVSQTGDELVVLAEQELVLRPHDYEFGAIERKTSDAGAPNLIAADKRDGMVLVYGLDTQAWARGEVLLGAVTQSLPIPGAPRDVEVIDLDGDGLTDLVGSGDALWVALSSRRPDAGPPYTGAPKRPPQPRVVINEILASNNRYRFAQTRNETPDCVEIFNGTGVQQSMRNWKLRRIDDEGTEDETIREFTFDFWNDTLGGGERLTLFCSTRGDSSRHTGFKLPASGTTLELVDDTGRVVDRVTYPPLELNVSFGRYQDGVGAFRHNLFPDIGRENVDNGELEPTLFFRGVDFSEMKPDQPFRVTSRANDDVGVIALSVACKSLKDPFMPAQRVVLYDDGMHDDGGLLDGFFAGKFPPMAEGEEIQFYVEAADLDNKNTYLPSDPIFARNRQQLSMVYTLGIGQTGARDLKIVEVVTDNETIRSPGLDQLNDDGVIPNYVTPDYLVLRNDGQALLDLTGLTLTQSFFGDGRGDFTFSVGPSLRPGEERRVYFADKPLLGVIAPPIP